MSPKKNINNVALPLRFSSGIEVGVVVIFQTTFTNDNNDISTDFSNRSKIKTASSEPNQNETRRQNRLDELHDAIRSRLTVFVVVFHPSYWT